MTSRGPLGNTSWRVSIGGVRQRTGVCPSGSVCSGTAGVVRRVLVQMQHSDVIRATQPSRRKQGAANSGSGVETAEIWGTSAEQDSGWRRGKGMRRIDCAGRYVRGEVAQVHRRVCGLADGTYACINNHYRLDLRHLMPSTRL